MKTARLPLNQLVFDGNLYPRCRVDPVYVSALVKALRGGAKFPPLTVCAGTRKIVDGAHRSQALQIFQGQDALVDVELRDYDSDADRFLDCVRLNAGHGHRLTPYDQAHCLAVAERIGLAVDSLAAALSLRVEDLGAICAQRMGVLHVRGQPDESIPLKSGARHLAGRLLKRRQIDGLPKLGGMSATYCVGQILNLLRSDLLDFTNETLVARLHELSKLLEERLGARTK